MATPDGRFVLTYNGEVYNFRELRIELEAHGCAVPLARRHRGRALRAGRVGARRAGALQRACSRWPCGTRASARCCWPATATGSSRCTGRASATRSCSARRSRRCWPHPALRARLDERALLEYFTFQNLFTRRTLFAGVELLPPGTFLTLRAGEGRRVDSSRPSTGTSTSASPGPTRGASTSASTWRSWTGCSARRVKRQLVSDVPVGAYLSAAAWTRARSPRWPRRSSTPSPRSPSASTFPRRRAWSWPSTSATGPSACPTCSRTEHYEMVLKAGDMERVMPALTWHLEDLRVGQCYPNYYAARLASKFVTVVLSGAGGDELFGGYPWRYYRAVVNDSFDDYVGKYYGFWQRLLPHRHDRELLPADLGRGPATSTRATSSADAFGRHASQLTRRRTTSTTRSTSRRAPSCTACCWSRTSCDGALAGDAPAVPGQRPRRLRHQGCRSASSSATSARSCAWTRTSRAGRPSASSADARDGKLLLRRAMERYVPEDITGREKQGFAAPDASWFRGESHRLRTPPPARRRRAHLLLPRPRRGACARRRPSVGAREPAAADLVAAVGRGMVPHVSHRLSWRRRVAPMFMPRRRPLMRGAMIGGAGYMAGKSAANKRAAEQDQNQRIAELEAQQAQAPAPAAPPRRRRPRPPLPPRARRTSSPS